VPNDAAHAIAQVVEDAWMPQALEAQQSEAAREVRVVLGRGSLLPLGSNPEA
jgi:hypothetical protein